MVIAHGKTIFSIFFKKLNILIKLIKIILNLFFKNLNVLIQNFRLVESVTGIT